MYKCDIAELNKNINKNDGAEKELKKLGIYVHIPFCKSKCYYCDFNSYPSMEGLIPEYFEALKKEICLYEGLGVGHFENRESCKYEITSIFFGGGTPSLPDAGYICGIIEELFKRFCISENVEITIEANPGTLTLEKLKKYKRAGVNRLSIGLQAWQNRLLESMGRIHTARDFIVNLNHAREVGFDNINVDLIFGLPGQSMRDWEITLDRVMAENVEHISCYDLKIEEGTVLRKKIEDGEIQEIEDELDRDMYHYAVKEIRNRGYIHYEISNFSKAGYESRHNMIYWKGQEYIGLGAGAHSYFDGKRYHNVEKPVEYVYKFSTNENTWQHIQEISQKDQITEYLILGLRLTGGISLIDFKARFGIELLELYGDRINTLMKRGLLCRSGERLRLTDLGLDLANQVFVEFI